MNDKQVFIDTNILVYTYSEAELAKQQVARSISSNQNAWISTQVLQEFSNVLLKKFKKPPVEIKATLTETSVFTNTRQTIFKAVDLLEKYGFSFYDSLILASALESNCEILYSEDLSHNQLIEGKLRILNPFLI
jgi:predicted nucleic acid-binding protein